MRRLFTLVITLLVVSVIIFAMARASGDPRGVLLSDYAGPEEWEEMGRVLGLDKPLVTQYGLFLKDAIRFDFGDSLIDGQSVMGTIIERLPATFQLAAAAFGFSLIVGVPLGVLSAVKRGKPIDYLARFLALFGQSAPPFALGIFLIFIFGVKLEWLPTFGRSGPSSIVLPAITLGGFFIAANVRLVRSAMLDVLDSEYIKLARAKGVSTRHIIWKHALKNAILPMLTFSGITLGILITGALVTETVFAWPGLGRLAVTAVFTIDYPLLQGVVIVFTLMYCVASMMVDVAYAYIDPRIRYS
jgi:peptide/nickel transport system permease protein